MDAICCRPPSLNRSARSRGRSTFGFPGTARSASAWRAFRVGSTLEQIGKGEGHLLSASDDALVSQVGRVIRVEAPGRGLLGSMPVGGGADSSLAELAGSGRLYLPGEKVIVDFGGRELLRLDPPKGWGFRHGWSADGGRLLFDRFTRRVSSGENVIDSVFGGPQPSNSETVTVISTRNGAVCFSLDSPGVLLGLAGSYHADISPSGRFVVVATLSNVSVYRLPNVCTDSGK